MSQDNKQSFERKTKDIQEVLGLSDEEYNQLFAENTEEIQEFFNKKHFNEQEKDDFRKMLGLNEKGIRVS